MQIRCDRAGLIRLSFSIRNMFTYLQLKKDVSILQASVTLSTNVDSCNYFMFSGVRSGSSLPALSSDTHTSSDGSPTDTVDCISPIGRVFVLISSDLILSPYATHSCLISRRE